MSRVYISPPFSSGSFLVFIISYQIIANFSVLFKNICYWYDYILFIINDYCKLFNLNYFNLLPGRSLGKEKNWLLGKNFRFFLCVSFFFKSNDFGKLLLWCYCRYYPLLPLCLHTKILVVLYFLYIFNLTL